MLEGEIKVNLYPENIHLDLLNQNKTLKMLMLLHNRVSKEDMLKELNISEDEYNNNINRLFATGLIKASENKVFVPTCMIVNYDEENDIRNYVKTFGTDISEIIIEKYSLAKEKYSLLHYFENISFEEASFFILYNVMLDSWQLDQIVENFLRSDIPNRGGTRSFIMINQIDTAITILKNQRLENKSLEIGNYKLYSFGNLNSKNNFIEIDSKQLISDFKMNEFENESDFKKKIIDDLIKSKTKNKNAINQEFLLPLNKYGFLNNNQLQLPIIDFKDKAILSEISNLVVKDLIRYLDSKRPLFVKKYLSTIYKDEVSFREWSFWIYKFIIEEAAKILIDKGYIKQGNKNIFYYAITK